MYKTPKGILVIIKVFGWSRPALDLKTTPVLFTWCDLSWETFHCYFGFPVARIKSFVHSFIQY